MGIKLLGILQFNKLLLLQDMKKIHSFNFDNTYQEYAAGTWRTKILWNSSGLDNDAISLEYDGYAKKTPTAFALSYINHVIEQNFNTRFLKSVRIFHSSNGGLILPHKDYLEFNKGFKRLHLILETDISCLNSENNSVYHMMQGELWFIDGNKIHSAASFSKTGKYALVLDFDSNIELHRLLANNHKFNIHGLKAKPINRKPLANDMRNHLHHLSEIITINNFITLFHFITQLHFEYDISTQEVFSIFRDICQNSNLQDVRNMYAKAEDLLIRKGPMVRNGVNSNV